MLMQTFNPADLTAFSRSQGEPGWFTALRTAAWEQSLELPKPNFRYGITIALNARDLDLDALEYRQALRDGTTITVAEQQELRGAVVADFRTALHTHGELIRTHLFSVLGEPENRLDAIHRALLANPMFIYVPRNVVVEMPITLRTRIHASVHCEHLLIIAESGSQVTIIDETESAVGHPDGALHTKAVEAIVGDGATVRYTAVQNLNPSVYHFTRKRATVGKDGRMDWLDCCMGGKLAQVEVHTSLDGTGAASNNWGMFFGRSAQQFDLSATVRHAAPHTTSDMLTKGAVTDHAKAIYRGLIRMERNAVQSNGFQRADTLLLSPDAEADNIPALEIDNADVKCSHASTIGQVDADRLFYLMSRGIPEDAARRMLVQSLFAPLIARVESTVMQQILQRIILERI